MEISKNFGPSTIEFSTLETTSKFAKHSLTSVCLTSVQVGDGLEIRALNFKQLHKVLSCAGDKKLKEVQLCLEGTGQGYPYCNVQCHRTLVVPFTMQCFIQRREGISPCSIILPLPPPKPSHSDLEVILPIGMPPDPLSDPSALDVKSRTNFTVTSNANLELRAINLQMNIAYHYCMYIWQMEGGCCECAD